VKHSARADARFAAAWWHWFFLGQTAKPAERVISADPDAWYQIDPEQMGDEAYTIYDARSTTQKTVHGDCARTTEPVSDRPDPR